eukprot:4705492-Alexandrium_andersonii.AAC.1
MAQACKEFIEMKESMAEEFNAEPWRTHDGAEGQEKEKGAIVEELDAGSLALAELRQRSGTRSTN